MDYIEIIAQILGMFGSLLAIVSFQEKKNKRFFIEQSLSGFMFFLNFILIGAYPAAFFNLTNVVRGGLLSKMGKNNKKVWILVVICGLYAVCFAFSVVMIWGEWLKIWLSAFTFLTLELMTVLMWLGNGKHIRYGQFLLSSPSWLIHNIFIFSLGGILCESFAMLSIIISFIRFGKDGFEK